MKALQANQGVFKNFDRLVKQFRLSVNTYSDSQRAKPVNYVIINGDQSKVQWPNQTLGPIDPVNPKYPLPGSVGLPATKNESSVYSSFVPAVCTLPQMREENYASILLGTDCTSELNNSEQLLIPPKSDLLECTILTCPTLIKQDLASVFPSKNFGTSPLTAIVLSHRTTAGPNQWGESAVMEREALAESFTRSAIDICASLKALGYWADFINPHTGLPYLGSHGEATMTETDEKMLHFGFELDDVACCKMLKHPRWKHDVFAGLIFTDAPKDHPDFFGIEQDQALRKLESQRKREADLENYVDELYFGVSEDSGLAHAVGFSPLDDVNEIDKQYLGAHQVDRFSGCEDLVTAPCQSLEIDETDGFIDSTYFQSTISAETPDSSQRHTRSLTEPTLRRRNKPNSMLRSKTFTCNQEANSEPQLHIADVVRAVRQKTRTNLWTGFSLDVPTRTGLIVERRDSQGYRIPDDDRVKFHYLTEEEAATVLFRSIVDIRENLLILNKPYGIPSHPGPGHKHSVAGLLPLVEHRIRTANSSISKARTRESETLSIVHRLDRGSTGLMLIARNRDSALKLQEAFANHWIQKDYLCITSGIPAYCEGTVELPLVEKKYDGVFKLCIAPLNRSASRAHCKQHAVEFHPADSDAPLNTDTRAPSTHYKVLDRRHGAALLLCSTVSGVKHQIRVHLSMGLHTPVLGDHKYSHATHMAPQRLSAPLRNSLQIRQSKARHLLLHLHASRMQVVPTAEWTPGFFDFVHPSFPPGRRVTKPEFDVVVPPPYHFRENMRRIGLKLPRFLSRVLI
ncbi:unnamed protein product [Dicrocoelium dendriticum]|nr:unnamed protein product [Dicrocoelium dendriticum]